MYGLDHSLVALPMSLRFVSQIVSFITFSFAESPLISWFHSLGAIEDLQSLTILKYASTTSLKQLLKIVVRD